MKIGFRKPNLKKSLKARTTGKIKRKAKKLINPFYGKKGMGWIKNPKKALYNKIYHKTTVGVSDIFKFTSNTNRAATKKKNYKNASTNIESELKQLKSMSNKINTTTNPDQFFKCYEELILRLRNLADQERAYKFSYKLPSQNLMEILAKRVDTINDFIFRYYCETRLKVENLKQVNAKISNIEKFKNKLEANRRYMDNSNIDRFENMYKRLKEDCL